MLDMENVKNAPRPRIKRRIEYIIKIMVEFNNIKK
jgi:hypothetical protein